jgi:hypothetical protein
MSMMCRILGHRRSAKQAKFNFESQRWESVCVQCRKPMVRIAKREWRLANEVREAQKPQLS